MGTQCGSSAGQLTTLHRQRPRRQRMRTQTLAGTALGIVGLYTATSAFAEPISRRVAIASDDSGGSTATLRAFDTAPPWDYVTPPLAIPSGSFLRFALGRV